MSKPKIYSFCKAGCQWETVHKSDFEKSAAYIQLAPNESDGYYYLEVGKTYRIVDGNAATAWTAGIRYTVDYTEQHASTGATNTTFSKGLLDLPTFGSFVKDFTFAFLGVECKDGGFALVSLLNRERTEQLVNPYTDTNWGEGYSVTSASLREIRVEGATAVYLINEDAQTKAAQGDAGDSVFVRYSAYADGTDFTKQWSEGQSYIGVATAQEAPTDKTAYVWSKFVTPQFTSAIKGNAIGAAVELTDVHSIEHTVYVMARGRNAIFYPYGCGDSGKFENGSAYVEEYTFYVQGNGTLLLSEQASAPPAGNEFIELQGALAETAWRSRVKKGQYIVLSAGCTSADIDIVASIRLDSGKYVRVSASCDEHTVYQLPEDGNLSTVRLCLTTKSYFSPSAVVKPMLEVVDYYPTTFSEFVKGISFNANIMITLKKANGEIETLDNDVFAVCEVTSTSPNMSFTVAEENVVLDVDYLQDATAVIKKLTNAIKALGGEV